MKIRMTESFLIEADSIKEVEQAYAEGFLYEMTPEFISVGFTEEKEKKEMREVTLTLEEYTDLVLKANDFERLKATARNKPYLSELEKVIFGLHEEPTEDDF